MHVFGRGRESPKRRQNSAATWAVGLLQTLTPMFDSQNVRANLQTAAPAVVPVSAAVTCLHEIDLYSKPSK